LNREEERSMPGLDTYQDRTAVVTGASSGIGRGLALELARRGMRLALVARRREQLEELAAEIAKEGGEASVHACDVGDRAQSEKAIAEVRERHGGVDLLVNNAGFVRHILFKDHDVDEIERMLRVNYLGPVYWMKALLPDMRAQGRGWILNMSSFAGVTPQPDEAAYSASKYALTGLSESIAPELEPLGIHVLVVHPVLVRTEMFTDEINARMPKGSEGAFISVEEFVAETLRALEAGETSIVIPRRYRAAPVLRSLFPGRVGRALAQAKLSALSDLTR
jgi:short-subunit dehydrogenase